jgi:hypothetical protein
VNDFDKIKGYQPWIEAGIGDRVVTWDEWLSILAAYKETRRALENAIKGECRENRAEFSPQMVTYELARARTELAQEAMQGRAE